MMLPSDMNRDISELYRLLNNLIQFATVYALEDSPEGKRVVCITADGLETKPLPLGVEHAGDDRTSWLPSVGEQVLIFSPGGVTEQGVVGPSLWSKHYPAPSVDPDKPTIRFKDGAEFSYDKAKNHLSVRLPPGGTTTIVSPGGTTHLGDFGVDGIITSTKSIFADEEVSDGKRSMQEDRDIYNQHAKGNHNPPAPQQ